MLGTSCSDFVWPQLILNLELQARKRRAAAAADRRNKVMAQMNRAQSKFTAKFAAEMEAMEIEGEDHSERDKK